MNPANTLRRPPLIVGIAGASGSGKSYLAKGLSQALQAPVLSLDSYYRDLAHLTPEQRAASNFDHPDSLDWPLLRAQVAALAAGDSVAVPVYDFATHTRRATTYTLAPARHLILEGIFALHDPEIRGAMFLRVFVEIEDAVCFARRLERDVDQRGRTPECVERQYRGTVAPMYREFVAPTRAFAGIIVRGDAPLADSVPALLACLAESPAYAG